MNKQQRREFEKRRSKKRLRRIRRIVNGKRKAKNKNSRVHKRDHNISKSQLLLEKQEIKLQSPEDFSIISNINSSLKYISNIRMSVSENKKVIMDMVITNTDFPTLSLVIATMFDKKNNSKTKWAHSTHIEVRNNEINRLLKKMDFDNIVRGNKSSMSHFLSRTDDKVNAEHKEQISKMAQDYFGDISKTDFNRIITEIITNTTNHAAEGKYSSNNKKLCHINVLFDEDSVNKIMKVCMVDLGVGIYESVKYKGESKGFWNNVVDDIKKNLLNNQTTVLNELFKEGGLSETGDPTRGTGLPALYKSAQKPNISKFICMTNGAYIDLKDYNKSKKIYPDFEGTLYYWEMTQRKDIK